MTETRETLAKTLRRKEKAAISNKKCYERGITAIHTPNQAKILAHIGLTGTCPGGRKGRGNEPTKMKIGGLVENPYLGVWTLTEAGVQELEDFCQRAPAPVWPAEVRAWKEKA